MGAAGQVPHVVVVDLLRLNRDGLLPGAPRALAHCQGPRVVHLQRLASGELEAAGRVLLNL